jgi:hypothetical protein
MSFKTTSAVPSLSLDAAKKAVPAKDVNEEFGDDAK